MKYAFSKKLITLICTLTISIALSNAAIENTTGQIIPLPKPKLKGTASLEELLWQRKSSRSFSERIPGWEQIGQLLWAAQGVNRPENLHRTAPSAWGMYPLEIYVILPSGVYHYLPDKHVVVQTRSGDIRDELEQAGLSKATVHHAPCVFVICANLMRTVPKADSAGDALRYIFQESGHAAQNLLLQLIPLGMGGVPIGANIPVEGQNVIGIAEDEKVVYILAAGFLK